MLLYTVQRQCVDESSELPGDESLELPGVNTLLSGHENKTMHASNTAPKHENKSFLDEHGSGSCIHDASFDDAENIGVT